MTECIICMDAFSEDRPKHTLICSHAFHFDCILQWAQSDNESHNSCPVCRLDADSANSYQIQSSFSWQTLQDRRKCLALIKIIKGARDQMSKDELDLLDYLMKQYDNIERKVANHAEEFRKFNKEHATTIRKYCSLRSNRYKLQTARVNHVRDILQLFSVVTIIKPRRDKTAVVVRRSERLEAQS